MFCWCWFIKVSSHLLIAFCKESKQYLLELLPMLLNIPPFPQEIVQLLSRFSVYQLAHNLEAWETFKVIDCKAYYFFSYLVYNCI